MPPSAAEWGGGCKAPRKRRYWRACLKRPQAGCPEGDLPVPGPGLRGWRGLPGWKGPRGAMPATPFRAPKARLGARPGGVAASLRGLPREAFVSACGLPAVHTGALVLELQPSATLQMTLEVLRDKGEAAGHRQP